MSDIGVDSNGAGSVAAGPRGGLQGWVKKNKALAIAIVGGAAFVFVTQRGQKENSGGEFATDVSEGDPIANGVIVPLSGESEYGTYDDEYSDQRFSDIEEQLAALAGTVESLGDDDDVDPVGDNPANPADDGITINGKKFPRATNYTITGHGKRGAIEYLITFPGKTQTWTYSPSKGWSKGPIKDSSDGPGGKGQGGSGDGGKPGGKGQGGSGDGGKPGGKGQGGSGHGGKPGGKGGGPGTKGPTVRLPQPKPGKPNKGAKKR